MWGCAHDDLVCAAASTCVVCYIVALIFYIPVWISSVRVGDSRVGDEFPWNCYPWSGSWGQPRRICYIQISPINPRSSFWVMWMSLSLVLGVGCFGGSFSKGMMKGELMNSMALSTDQIFFLYFLTTWVNEITWGSFPLHPDMMTSYAMARLLVFRHIQSLLHHSLHRTGFQPPETPFSRHLLRHILRGNGSQRLFQSPAAAMCISLRTL